jgi:hypothetical protein
VAIAALALSLPLCAAKAAALRHGPWAPARLLPFYVLLATHAAFAAAHAVAAQRSVRWARRRWQVGLGGFGYPWQAGEGTWLLAGELRSHAQGFAEGTANADADVAPESLADEGSRFAEFEGGAALHYRVCLPAAPRQGADAAGAPALVLVHGFGGGTFAWRHVMQPLADCTGLVVAAADRPGFGERQQPGRRRGRGRRVGGRVSGWVPEPP